VTNNGGKNGNVAVFNSYPFPNVSSVNFDSDSGSAVANFVQCTVTPAGYLYFKVTSPVSIILDLAGFVVSSDLQVNFDFPGVDWRTASATARAASPSRKVHFRK
jgi:hypothetical protein